MDDDAEDEGRGMAERTGDGGFSGEVLRRTGLVCEVGVEEPFFFRSGVEGVMLIAELRFTFRAPRWGTGLTGLPVFSA